MSKDYNGWTNYETWLVQIWMDKDQGSQECFRERAKAAYANAIEMLSGPSVVYATKYQSAVLTFADGLRAYWCDESMPELPGIYGDLLGAALAEVNWFEIARHWIDAAVEASNAA